MIPSVHMNNMEQVYDFIESFQNQIDNIKQKGEVFTPNQIIEKMLDELDSIYFKEHECSIFTNPNLKWYDNSSGIGNFMINVFNKLYNGLEKIYPAKEKRIKHIIEEMLFMSEINQNNINICKKIFNPDNNLRDNIFCQDSLKDTKFKYDIIIGNPPYQKPNSKNNNSRGGTNNNLYIDFIKHSFKQLTEQGYLAYINPQGWRKINSPVLKDILSKNIKHISLNYGGSLFKGISVKTDFFIVKNSKQNHDNVNIKTFNKKNSLMIESDTRINPGLEFLPNIFDSNINSILEKMKSNGIQVECKNNSYCHKVRNHVQKGKNNQFIFPLFNTSGKPFLYFSSKPHPDQYRTKVIMSCSGKLSPFCDSGVYGVTQDSMYILVENENHGNFLVNTLNSKLYRFMINICQWGNFRNEPKLISGLFFPRYQNLNVDDEWIANYFQLTSEETKFISDFLLINPHEYHYKT